MDPPSASVSSSGHEIFGIHQSPGVEELWATSRAERWLLVDVGDAWAPLEPRWNPVGAPLGDSTDLHTGASTELFGGLPGHLGEAMAYLSW